MKKEKMIEKFLYAALVYAIVIGIYGIQKNALALFIQLCVAVFCGFAYYLTNKNMLKSIGIGFLSAFVIANIFTIVYILTKLNKMNYEKKHDTIANSNKNKKNEVEKSVLHTEINSSYEGEVCINRQKDKKDSSTKDDSFGYIAGISIVVFIVLLVFIYGIGIEVARSDAKSHSQNIEIYKSNMQEEKEI
jgi:uncharacterized membrane protein